MDIYFYFLFVYIEHSGDESPKEVGFTFDVSNILPESSKQWLCTVCLYNAVT
jgi:hypothetical protein